MATMRAVQVPEPNAPFQLVQRPVPVPGAGEVRLKVLACGVCHSDSFTKQGTYPGIGYPRVPGHEIAGVVDAVGSGVSPWQPGDRAGVGWHGGHCGLCTPCRRGDFVSCLTAPQVPGISYDGGYAEYVIVPASTLARIPRKLSPVEAAPIMCAGVTTFNALRNSGARGGDLVAVLGVGGLGHLGIQFSAKMGFNTVAIARGRDKEASARELGASDYIDSTAGDVAAALARLGGARVILATATSGKAMSSAINGLGVNGRLMIIGAAADPIDVSAHHMIMGRRSIQGWPSGTSLDSEEALAFCADTGVRALVETFPLERAAEAYERMMSGKARFRVVITTEG